MPIALGTLAVFWYLHGYTAADVLESLRLHARGPMTPLVVVLVYVVGGFVFMPVMALIALTGLVFGPAEGALYSLLGAAASAACAYAAGHLLSFGLLKRYAGPRITQVRKQLKARGLAAVILVRVIPSGPFTLLNLVAGASSIRFRDFLLGTVIGMTPGIAITVGLVHGLRTAWQAPSAATLCLLALGVAAACALAYGARRAMKRRQRIRAAGS